MESDNLGINFLGFVFFCIYECAKNGFYGISEAINVKTITFIKMIWTVIALGL